MNLESGRLDLIAPTVPVYLLAAAAVALMAAWIGSHFLKARFKTRLAVSGFFAVRVIAGTFAVWTVLQLAARYILLATEWSLWFSSFVAGITIETVVWLYELERASAPKRTGRLLVALRITLLLLVLFMILQPVLSHEVKRGLERQLVVLVDDSQSMHMEDRQLTISEKLDLADLYNLEQVRNRYRLGSFLMDSVVPRRTLGAEMETLSAASPAKSPDDARKALVKAIESVRTVCNRQLDIVDAVQKDKDKDKFDQQTRDGLEDIRRRLKDTAIPKLGDALAQLDRKDGDEAGRNREALNHLKASDDAITEVVKRLPSVMNGADETFYRGLTEQQRKQIDEMAGKTRSAIARQVLAGERSGGSILKRIQDKYGLRLVRYGARTAEVDPKEWAVAKDDPAISMKDIENGVVSGADTKEQSFRQRTDITMALEQALKDVPAENLAGVLMLTDGRHNGEAAIEPVARRFGAQRAPVCSVVIGGTASPKDASVLNVRAPESVYAGDKVGVRADLKLDGMRGGKVKVKLMHNGAQVSDKVVDVPEDSFRTTVRFAHTPQGEGTLEYAVEIEPVEGETFLNNNKWPFIVAVSGDRTNVLLVEGRPRWEYRYLRNLFFGRDKSVHLQYVLLNPDSIEGAPTVPTVFASASRKFGDAEATALPKDRNEWMKFDVIILGDIPPSALDDKTMETIKACVADRGAMLIVIAGPLYMPHAYDSKILKDLLPVKFETALGENRLKGPEQAYKLALTPDGRSHTIMQESTSSAENTQIWEGLPELSWRHAIIGAKDGATVLAFAKPIDPAQKQAAAAPAETLSDAADELSTNMRMQSKNALIAVQNYSHGKVMMLNFDGIWRLRYKVGDTYHHKFWGQALRWGAAENLRAGTESVRLGTDKLTYSANDPIHVTAKITTGEYTPVNNDNASVIVSQDGKVVGRKKLEYRKDSNGMYDATLEPLPKTGKYKLELKGDRASKILADAKVDKVETDIVVETKSNIEFSELAADRTVPGKIAGLSGAAISGIDGADRLLEFFGPGSEMVKERKDTTLWDSWLLLLLILCVVSCEWIVRKIGGLT